MQPKRDPADTRYWPCRVPGSTGQGFSYAKEGKPASEKHGSILGPQSRLSLATKGLTVASRPTMNPDTLNPPISPEATRQAVRTKARLVSLKLLDRAESLANSMEAKELGSVLSVAGKLAGVETQSIQVKHSHTLIPAEQRAERASQLLAKARLALSNSSADDSQGHNQSYTLDTVDAQVVDTQGDSTE